MSIVIASKYQNGVMLMADRQVTRYRIQAVKDSVEKIYSVPGEDILIGGVGTLRELQQIKKISTNIFDVSKKLTERNCIDAVDKITHEFRENGYINPNIVVDDLSSQFLFCDAYNINYVGGDLGVIGNLNYFAIGCGEDLVMGYLNTVFKDKGPEEFTFKEIKEVLEESIKVSCKDSLGIDDNINMLYVTKMPLDLIEDNTINIIDMCEYKTVKKQTIDKSKICVEDCKNCIHNIRFIWDKKRKTVTQMFKRC